jgi:hypothetical protein
MLKTPTSTPTSKSEVASLLSQHQVAMVHCLGDVSGVGDPSTKHLKPLDKLVNAFADRPDVSCSTVKAGDSRTPSNGMAKKYFGPFGLIIDPVSFQNISLSYPSDAGSTYCPIAKKRIYGRGLGDNAPAHIESAIINRGTDSLGTPSMGYNEICCFGFKVLGLFADVQYATFSLEQAPFEVPISITELGAAIPELPLFYWVPAQAQFLRLDYSSSQGGYDKSSFRPVSLANIYDCSERY